MGARYAFSLRERNPGRSSGVSRTVIRPALALLESDGQLVRAKGRGNFVAAPKHGVQVRGLGWLLSGFGEPDIRIDILEAKIHHSGARRRQDAAARSKGRESGSPDRARQSTRRASDDLRLVRGVGATALDPAYG